MTSRMEALFKFEETTYLIVTSINADSLVFQQLFDALKTDSKAPDSICFSILAHVQVLPRHPEQLQREQHYRSGEELFLRF